MCSAEPGRKAAYSADIRWRIVWQRLSMDLCFVEIAERLNIAVSTAHRIYHLFEQSGNVCPKPNNTPRPDTRKLSDDMELFIIGLVLENPGIYLSEVCKEVEDISGIVVSDSTVCKLIRRHGLTRKKIQQIALQRSSQIRGEFMGTVLLHRKDQFVWLDETGCDNRHTMRKYGYAIRGETPRCHRLLTRGQRVSAVAALSTEGLLAVELTSGTVDSEVFFDFVRGSVIPLMNPFDGSSPKSILVLDNCSVHHVPGIAELFRLAGILVLYLPPYSPDYNPIEETFSYVKYYLKRHDTLLQQLNDKTPLIRAAFDSITPDLAKAWIIDCGYF